tara:strand:- start:385 stop:1668 length:1284 start_codon:yes stop_codon:yes gene_type:complete
MKLFNQLLNYKLYNFEYLTLILFSILPISFIIGNAIININIVLIDLLFLFVSFKFKSWKWLKNDIFVYLIILYCFLVLNSIFSYFFKFNDDFNSIFRSILFLKFILLVFAFETLLQKRFILSTIFKFWLLTVTVIVFDIFFEKTFGQNIFGNISPDGTRVVSFFKDELIVGAFTLCFGFTTITFFLHQDNIKLNKIFFTLLFILIPISIFLSGERSNFIKSFILFFFIIIFIEKNKFFFNKKLLFTFFISLILIFLFINKNTYIKYTELFKRIAVAEKNSSIYKKFENIKYFAHYDTAVSIFRNNIILGVGNKNFRKECKKDKYYNKEIKFTESRCSTHPHQVHFEILSEQGLLGYIIILYIMFFFLKKNLKIYGKKRDISHLNNITYLMLFFIPLLPGSGIFNTLSGSMFWIIFALCNLNYETKNF